MENGQGQPSTTFKRARSSIELIIFGFMVSLTLKAGLDTAYSKTIPMAITWSDLFNCILIFPSLQLFIYLITLMRFVYGAYRTLEAVDDSSEELESWVLIWNIPGMLMLFVFFYITSLSVQHPESFYISIGLVHIWDLVWFLIPATLSSKLDSKMKDVMKRFLIIDVLTVLALSVSMFVLKLSGNQFAIIGAVIMVVFGFLDFLWNRKFFFYKDTWRT